MKIDKKKFKLKLKPETNINTKTLKKEREIQ